MLRKTFGLVLSLFAIPWALAQDEVSALAAASAAKARFETRLADLEMARLFGLSPQKQAEAKLASAQDTLTWAQTRWDRRAAREHATSARLTYERLENQLRRRWEKAQILLAERDEKKTPAGRNDFFTCRGPGVGSGGPEVARPPGAQRSPNFRGPRGGG